MNEYTPTTEDIEAQLSALLKEGEMDAFRRWAAHRSVSMWLEGFAIGKGTGYGNARKDLTSGEYVRREPQNIIVEGV